MEETQMSIADQMKQQQMAVRQQEQMAKAQEHVSKIVRGYYANPSAFSDSETKQIMMMAQQVGIPFEPAPNTSRAIKNGVFNLLDTAALGLIPDSWGPEKLTTRDEVGSAIGGVLGFAVPGAIGMKAGSAALKGAKSMAAGDGLAMLRGAQAAETIGPAQEAGALFSRIAEMKPGKTKDTLLNLLDKAYGASKSPSAKKIANSLLQYNVPFTNFNALRAGSTLGTAMMLNNILGESPEEQQAY